MRESLGHTCPWDAIISSPLSRCFTFAREFARRHSLPLDVDERLQEIHLGEWEGRNVFELLAKETRRIARFVNDPTGYTPPGAEPVSDFLNRVLTAWDEHVSRRAGQHLLFIGHGGTIRAILGRLFDIPLDALLHMELPHASLSRVQLKTDMQGLQVPTMVFQAGRM
jgi:alpha-ribazole phosphatase